MQQSILALDRKWEPHCWMNLEDTIVAEVKGNIIDHVGEKIYVYRGGTNRVTGEQSRIETSSIVVIDGEAVGLRRYREPSLTNSNLFVRDCYMCAYCGGIFSKQLLTRDHVHPTSKGGQDTWMNTVSSCKDCNALKGDTLPGVKLPNGMLGPQGTYRMDPLFVPYVPCAAEHMIMKGRNVQADQMEFLLSRVRNKKSRIFEYAANYKPNEKVSA